MEKKFVQEKVLSKKKRRKKASCIRVPYGFRRDRGHPSISLPCRQLLESKTDLMKDPTDIKTAHNGVSLFLRAKSSVVILNKGNIRQQVWVGLDLYLAKAH